MRKGVRAEKSNCKWPMDGRFSWLPLQAKITDCRVPSPGAKIIDKVEGQVRKVGKNLYPWVEEAERISKYLIIGWIPVWHCTGWNWGWARGYLNLLNMVCMSKLDHQWPSFAGCSPGTHPAGMSLRSCFCRYSTEGRNSAPLHEVSMWLLSNITYLSYACPSFCRLRAGLIEYLLSNTSTRSISIAWHTCDTTIYAWCIHALVAAHCGGCRTDYYFPSSFFSGFLLFYFQTSQMCFTVIISQPHLITRKTDFLTTSGRRYRAKRPGKNNNNKWLAPQYLKV